VLLQRLAFNTILRKNNGNTYLKVKISQNTNKIEPLGTIRKHKFLVECNGNGGFNIKEINSVEDKLEIARKLREKNLITEKEYRKKRKEILKSL
jgi:hypothetical protein